MKKSRASLEPFWDLKISKYVEYLTRVAIGKLCRHNFEHNRCV